ncbi:hypothetical protein D3C78_1668660 [compost metagenome]
MPAVAPQATNSRKWRGGNNRNRPLNDDNMAANCTIGPSRPMEAPELMEKMDDRLRASVWRRPMTPRPMEIASM